jgi:anaerobic selenocysteine-containing dehydrogenase
MAMAVERTSTYCRVCEAACGLLAEREHNTVLSLRPDKSHAVSQGFACLRGLLALDIHKDEDRLNYPLRRTNSRSEAVGQFERISWDQSAAEISRRLKDILQKYGAGAVSVYAGNPLAFDSSSGPAMGSFLGQLGINRIFNAGTQDCANKFAVGEDVFGLCTLHPIPDIDHTDYLLIIGSNPKISHMSFITVSDPMAKLRAARQRGATIRYVNPRKIESADGTGAVLQLKPDTDLYLLAALLHEIERMGGFKQDVISAHGKNIDGLKAFIAQYPPKRIEKVVGIPAEVISGIAREFSQAGKASVYMSTGANMGRQGTLTYWLVQMLSFVTGNLDKEGGNYCPLGFNPAMKGGPKPEDPFLDSPFGPLRTIPVLGSLPGNLLADMIDTETEPIRALFVMAGNPVLSIAGEEQLRKAFGKLELLVVLDIYRSATGEMADYLLPCADMLERADMTSWFLDFQHTPYVQYTDAVVPPRYERKELWWILARVEQALGLASVLDDNDYDRCGVFNLMLSPANLSIEELKHLPCQTAVMSGSGLGRFYSDWLQTPDRKVDCCPAIYAESIEAARAILHDLDREPEDQLKLISGRNGMMHNSWYQNLERLKKGEHRTNPIYMNAEDARKRGIETGDKVRMHNRWGVVEAEARVDARLRRGVVSMAHGWGNKSTPGMKVAQRFPGANVNQLLPHGPGSYEKISNQAHMTGIAVDIERT